MVGVPHNGARAIGQNGECELLVECENRVHRHLGIGAQAVSKVRAQAVLGQPKAGVEGAELLVNVLKILCPAGVVRRCVGPKRVGVLRDRCCLVAQEADLVLLAALRLPEHHLRAERVLVDGYGKALRVLRTSRVRNRARGEEGRSFGWERIVGVHLTALREVHPAARGNAGLFEGRVDLV